MYFYDGLLIYKMNIGLITLLKRLNYLQWLKYLSGLT